MDYDKENSQEEENLMNSETFVNDVYDEQVRQGGWEDSEENAWWDMLKSTIVGWVNVAVVYTKLLLTNSLVCSSALKNYKKTCMK